MYTQNIISTMLNLQNLLESFFLFSPRRDSNSYYLDIRTTYIVTYYDKHTYRSNLTRKFSWYVGNMIEAKSNFYTNPWHQ